MSRTPDGVDNPDFQRRYNSVRCVVLGIEQQVKKRCSEIPKDPYSKAKKY